MFVSMRFTYRTNCQTNGCEVPKHCEVTEKEVIAGGRYRVLRFTPLAPGAVIMVSQCSCFELDKRLEARHL